MKTKKEPRIDRGITKIIVPHENEEVTFVYPLVGKGKIHSLMGFDNYKKVGEGILNQGFRLPTAEETVSLIYAAYFSDVKDELEFENIREIMSRGLWVFNRILWAENGVYVVQDPQLLGISQPIDINDLERELENCEETRGIKVSTDRKVRFAPKNTYYLDTQEKLPRSGRVYYSKTQKKLSKNGFVIASYGVEGAKKLEEVAEQLKCPPYVSAEITVEGLQIRNLRISYISICKAHESTMYRLGINGNVYRDGDHTAFGVLI